MSALVVMETDEKVPPNVTGELPEELKGPDNSLPEGVTVIVNDDGLSIVFAEIEGPSGTPYEDGIFLLKLTLPHDFPRSPPEEGCFMTKIFHPNIAPGGEIGLNTLKKDWSPSLGLRHVMLVVRSLLIEPFVESIVNAEAGELFLENYDKYAQHARLCTEIHALRPVNKSKTGAILGAILESTTALIKDQSNHVFSESVRLSKHRNAVRGPFFTGHGEMPGANDCFHAASASFNVHSTSSNYSSLVPRLPPCAVKEDDDDLMFRNLDLLEEYEAIDAIFQNITYLSDQLSRKNRRSRQTAISAGWKAIAVRLKECKIMRRQIKLAGGTAVPIPDDFLNWGALD